MKKILLLVTGMSPQIVTETLYGLAVKPAAGQSVWIPDEVHLVSTTTGIEQARLKLLAGNGYFDALRQDYHLPMIAFNETSLHPILDNTGHALADLKTPEDNECAANTICEKIRELTQDSHSELHVSIAGGRKTMGFYAGYALSLYGRPQDHLSHVLVSEEYESLPDFFYPTPSIKEVYSSRLQRSFDASKAEIWLADIPFVRLRHHLPEKTLLHKATFSDVVQRIALATGDIRLTIDIKKQMLWVNGISCKLAARELAFYVWFAKRAQQNLPPIIAPKKDTPSSEYPELSIAFLNEYQKVKSAIGKGEAGYDAVDKTLKNGMDRGFFEQRLTAISKVFKAIYGEEVAKRLAIINSKRGQSRYGLVLTAKQIDILI